MKVSKCALDGVLLIEPATYRDDRGFFLESFQRERYVRAGIVDDFVQDNHSRSRKHVLRGLHFTRKKPQAQLVTVIHGRIFDVVVDIRRRSPSYGQWIGIELGDDTARQLYVPHGFAHGFCVLSDVADVHYKVSQYYDPDDEGGLLWNDETVNIAWPVKVPFVSARDRQHAKLGELHAAE